MLPLPLPQPTHHCLGEARKGAGVCYRVGLKHHTQPPHLVLILVVLVVLLGVLLLVLVILFVLLQCGSRHTGAGSVAAEASKQEARSEIRDKHQPAESTYVTALHCFDYC